MITATSHTPSTLKAELNLGYIWLISVVAALGGLLFGWDWVVIGGAKLFFESYFHITHNAQLSGWANSCALIGCLLGALVAGALSDRFGRKKLLLLAACLFAATSIGNALAPTFSIFIAWRILGGVAIGLASNLSPMYIAEIAPAQMRGKLVSINQLTIVVGILAAQMVNWYLGRNLPAGATDEYILNSWYGQLGSRKSALASQKGSIRQRAIHLEKNRRRKLCRRRDERNQRHARQRNREGEFPRTA